MKIKQYQIKKPDTTTARTTLFFILTLMFCIASVNAKTIDELFPSLETIQSPGNEADRFGSSIVRIDNLLFVGAHNDSSNGTLSGAVFVYQRQTSDTGKWTLVTTLYPLNPKPGERFGYSLATNQSALLIGAPASSQHATDLGAVYVFNFDESSQTWQQSAKLTAADGQPGDRFGFSIAIDGVTALIGAFLDDNDPLAQQTIHKLKPVKLYADYCPENSFCQHNSSPNKTTPKQTYVFEKEVSDDPGVDSGSVYVFTQNSNHQWTQAHKLTANNSEGSDFFGFQIALENNIAVISAPGKDHLDELSAGAVYLFKRNGNLNSAWQQIQVLRASDGKLDDLFGQSVAFHQQTIAIGAHKKDRIAQNTGSVYVFEPSNLSDQWIETGQLYNPDPAAQDQFGHGIALNDSLMLITAYNERINTPGAVYLFEKYTNSQSQSGWAFADKISLAPDQLERVGASIMLDHQAFAFGALDHSGNSNIVIASNTNISHVEQPTPVQPPAKVNPSNGLWWNPQQPGHGLDIKLAGDNLLAIWYTYRQDGTPVWYLASAPYQATQSSWSADLDLYRWDGQTATASPAGAIQLTFTDSSHAQLSWSIDGQSGTQPIEFYTISSQSSANDISGTWYEQQQPGYGLTGSIQGNTEIAVLYFYDSAGNPVWVLGSHDNPQADSFTVDVYQGSCPGCPFTASTAQPAGTLSTHYSSPASGRLSTTIQLPPPFSGSWFIDDKAITNLAWNLSPNQGALTINSQAQFQLLANPGRSIGVSGRPEIKFLIDDVDTDTPRLFFINSKNGTEGTYHYDFARNALNQYTDLSYRNGQALFSSQSYFTEQRRFLLGSVISYNRQTNQQSEAEEIYSIEFWPTDPVSFKLVNLAYQLIEQALPIAKQQLYYHPVGNTQQQLYSREQQRYDAFLKTIFTEELLADATHSVLNEGEAFGRLRVIEPGDPPASLTDIAIYRFIPNDLTHIAGIITEAPQTPLSHINLKARQNNTPNSYLINASSNDAISPLIGEWVHYQAIDNRIHITAASQQQVEDWFQAIRPAQPQIPGSDLSVIMPRRLTDIGFSDWDSFGVKAANVAELAKILPDGMVPDGYAIPFALYDEFMRLPRCGQDQTELCANAESGPSFYQQAQQILENPAFQNDTEQREQQLKAFRKAIRNAQAPQAMTATIEAIRLFWEPQGEPFTQSLRVRSSTNNEDLPGFNGAGLYSSYTHKKDEGKLIESIKQVWASLWNARAFDERDFHRVDHFKTYMGVLVHPNFGDEQANGVAVSKNIYNPNWQGIYCNVQYGEISITNPEPILTESGEIAAIPDEFIMTRLPISELDYDWETQFIRYSNVEDVYDQPVPPGNVLSESEMIQLRDAMLTVHNHFKQLYQGDKSFAMETEFKITETDDGSRGKLAIKQARPWVD